MLGIGGVTVTCSVEPLGCLERHLGEGRDVVPWSHGHALAPGEADVIAGLLLHACQDLFFVRGEIDQDRAGRLDRLWALHQPCLPQPIGHGVVQGGIWLEFECEGAQGVGVVCKGGQRLWQPNPNRALGDICQREAGQ